MHNPYARLFNYLYQVSHEGHKSQAMLQIRKAPIRYLGLTSAVGGRRKLISKRLCYPASSMLPSITLLGPTCGVVVDPTPSARARLVIDPTRQTPVHG